MTEVQPRKADAGKYHLFHGLAIVHDQASVHRLRNLGPWMARWSSAPLGTAMVAREPRNPGASGRVMSTMDPQVPKAPAALPASARGG